LVRLQQDWKKIGPVERKRSDEIWNRFRTACDAFFQAREAWFAGREGRDKASVDARKAIVADLEKVEAAESLEETMERIKPIQDAWNQAPQVGGNDRKALDKAWNDALNKVFSALNIDPVKRQRLEYKARIDAMMASPNALGLLRDERSFLGNRVRKLEEELLQTENNLAFFGKSKGAEALRQQYEGKMEQTRKEIEGLKDRQHQIKHALKQLESNS
jgi:DNA repair exonuclease SbcCD ATPase subunit